MTENKRHILSLGLFIVTLILVALDVWNTIGHAPEALANLDVFFNRFIFVLILSNAALEYFDGQVSRFTRIGLIAGCSLVFISALGSFVLKSFMDDPAPDANHLVNVLYDANTAIFYIGLIWYALMIVRCHNEKNQLRNKELGEK